jgi:hypothetical protein
MPRSIDKTGRESIDTPLLQVKLIRNEYRIIAG